MGLGVGGRRVRKQDHPMHPAAGWLGLAGMLLALEWLVYPLLVTIFSHVQFPNTCSGSPQQ